jgi:hypothetical protein
MKLVKDTSRFLVILMAFALAAASVPASAQEISEAHLKAARSAVSAIGATDHFDSILPGSAAALKQALIEKNPDLQELITQTVDAKTVEMASRRADLEKEAALAYAKVFSEEDLTAIATFYNGETGKKLIANGPIVTRELTKAAEIWQRGIARDLAEEVGKILTAASPQPAAPGEQPVPATGEQPAPATGEQPEPATDGQPAPAQ